MKISFFSTSQLFALIPSWRMFPSHPLRTKEEIEANRLAAEERLKKTRAEKARKYIEQQNRKKDDANRLVLSTDQRAFISAPTSSISSTLTPQERLRIERNKQEALERLRLKKQRKAAEEAGLASSGKAVPPSKAAIVNNRPKPYSKPSDNRDAGSTWGKQQTSSKSSMKPVVCEMEAISETRFSIKPKVYHNEIVDEFSKIASRIFSEF